MAALASDWLRHFRLFLWNRGMEFNKTWQEARSQRPLPSLCFLGWSEKTRWPPWPLIGWDIFDFSSETAERNSTKLDRKQDLNVLYQVCVFSGRSEKQDGCPGLWLAETFSTSPLKPLSGIQRNLTGSRFQRPLPSLCFAGRSVNKNVRLGRVVKKVAHCTQVHEMWPFGPLVSSPEPKAHVSYCHSVLSVVRPA